MLIRQKKQSIKDYVLLRILPPTETDDDSHAWDSLREILATRIKNAKENGASSRSVSEITEDTLTRLGKV